jgi:hypothetical protein
MEHIIASLFFFINILCAIELGIVIERMAWMKKIKEQREKIYY